MSTGIEDVLNQQDDGAGDTTPETDNTNTEGGDGKAEGTDAAQGDKTGTTDADADADAAEKTADAGKTAEKVPDIPPENVELNELRQFIREQRKEIAAMKAKLGRVKDEGEVDDEGNPVVTYTPMEKMQIELHNLATQRGPMLEMMVEMMDDMPKYSDVREVCSKSNFDDIFEMAAATISRQEKRDFNEVLVQLELEVWQKPNPYKYMYSIIKENHPRYAKKDETPKTTTTTNTETTTKTPDTAKKVIAAKAAPGSVAAAGAGENLNSGWTAAKIDALSEMELHTVPAEVYDKYMKGKLK